MITDLASPHLNFLDSEFHRDKFLDSHISIISIQIMNASEHKSYENLSFEKRSALKDLTSNLM